MTKVTTILDQLPILETWHQTSTNQHTAYTAAAWTSHYHLRGYFVATDDKSFYTTTNQWLRCTRSVQCFDTFQAKAKLCLAGEGVDPALQYNIIIKLGDISLKKQKRFNMSEEDRVHPVKVFNKFRESIGNDFSFHTA